MTNDNETIWASHSSKKVCSKCGCSEDDCDCYSHGDNSGGEYSDDDNAEYLEKVL